MFSFLIILMYVLMRQIIPFKKSGKNFNYLENTNIFYANEEFIELDELNNMSAIIKKSIDEFNLDKTVSILEQYVSGFKYNN